MRKVALLSILSLFVLSVVNCDKNTPIEEEPPPEEPEYYDDIGTMWQLTDLPDDETNPSWPPDGTKIAFQSNTSGQYEIYILGITSGEITHLTNNGGENPCWSPDGSLILYDGYFEGMWRAVYTISAEGGEPTLITRGIDDYHAVDPYWFPQMDRIVFVGNSEGFWRDAQSLYFLNLPDGDPILFKFADYYQYYKYPAISRDGNSLAYYYVQEEEPLYGQEHVYGIRVVDLHDYNYIFTDEAWLSSPAWSPNSNEIAYRDSYSGTDYNTELFVYSFPHETKRRVTDGTMPRDSLAWSPDGTKIVFASGEDGWDYRNNLWIVELNQR